MTTLDDKTHVRQILAAWYDRIGIDGSSRFAGEVIANTPAEELFIGSRYTLDFRWSDALGPDQTKNFHFLTADRERGQLLRAAIAALANLRSDSHDFAVSFAPIPMPHRVIAWRVFQARESIYRYRELGSTLGFSELSVTGLCNWLQEEHREPRIWEFQTTTFDKFLVHAGKVYRMMDD